MPIKYLIILTIHTIASFTVGVLLPFSALWVLG